ncbi:MAG: hypothetical protein OEW50_02795 [Gammaproteobacteria bacterium]|nr:hypothetical protein [Gammaproteobacteria bacterium]MDH5226321.1 hypothetical protein [Gammaproteobacteria bacterium]
MIEMRSSDRILAAGVAVLACLILGFVVASRPVARQAITPSASAAHPSQGKVSAWRTAFL